MNDTKDPKVQKTASVHPATVTQISKEVLEPVKRGPRGPYKKKEPIALVKDIKVHPEVWKRANEILSEGRYTTIEIVDDETVIVR